MKPSLRAICRSVCAAWQRPLFKSLLIFAIAALSGSASFSQPAPECLKTWTEGSKVIWQNTCDEPISVGYCSTGKPIWGKKCGDARGKTNVYYTQMTNMKPGAKSTESKDIVAAPCHGELNGWDLQGSFTSDADGKYDCFDPVKKRLTDYPMEATASASSQSRACTLAREMFAKQDRSPHACDCKGYQDNTLFICSARGKGQDTGGDSINKGISDVKALMREALQCNPKLDDRRCEKTLKPFAGSNGIRG